MSLRAAISALQDPDPTARRHAIEALSQVGGDEAAGALVLMLKDPDETVRTLAADVLAAIGASAVEPLSRCLATWQGPVGTLVPALLGRLRSDRGIDFLIAHLADPDPTARAAIATALGRIDSDRALPPLLELLRDMVDEVRIAAARAVGDVQDPSSVDALLDEMADENPLVRAAVVEALARIKSPKSIDILSHASTEDPDRNVREVALAALRRVSTGAVTPLIKALLGNDLGQRIRAVSQLLKQGKASVLPLTELLVHEESTVRGSAAEVLGALGDTAALNALIISAIADTDYRVRLSATTALGRVRHVRSAQVLAGLLEDQDDKIADAAALGLENQSELAVEPVFELLNHESVDVRVRAIHVLGRLRHRGACDRLLRGLTDKVIWVRIVSAQALGEIGDSHAAPALIAALKDRDLVVRAMAAEALGKLRDFAATMPLLALLSDESDLARVHALRALGRIGNPAAIPFLEPALDASEPEVRCAAIAGLAALRVTSILPKLHRMSRNWPVGREPKDVREAAQQAIAALQAAMEQETALTPHPEQPEENKEPGPGN
ncbi:HEAT repeat domain-containing protein [candidate division WOR-3 bacterium]|nr:HEAT repeat domain-containing protein [candidate division WOR-3 bacterium]